MDFKKITESVSNYDSLEKMTIDELTKNINKEDKSVANAVNKELKYINKLISKVIFQLRSGGRLFYIGSGTSGRLGIVDASECPPTFGVSHKLVIGIIAGGDEAIRKSVEKAEDNVKAIKDEIINTDNAILNSIVNANVTPNKAEWANVSPK